MERLGVRMQLLGGGVCVCVQARPAGTWERATLALFIYRPQWFTVIDVCIPECQNNLCFKRNQWLRLWFYLRPFPDKRLNYAWSCENRTGEHHSVLASVCVQGLGKGHLCVGLTFTSLVPWSLYEEHHSFVRSRKSRVWGQLCFSASSEHFCTALMWECGLQCLTAFTSTISRSSAEW